MPNRESIINGLKCCLNKEGQNPSCEECYLDGPGFGIVCRRTLMRDALTMLESQKWISVNDRLPTYAELKCDKVLVLFEDGDICSTNFDECIEGESIFGMWVQNFDPVTLGATDSDWMPCNGITHWMPIPELPKEE